MTHILALDRVSKAFASRGLRSRPFRRVDPRFQKHQFVTVVGASGCGKSTLLR
jgi:ABC-type nitrate/sulfonate/bicarbonate transport system ATPase subunit